MTATGEITQAAEEAEDYLVVSKSTSARGIDHIDRALRAMRNYPETRERKILCDVRDHLCDAMILFKEAERRQMIALSESPVTLAAIFAIIQMIAVAIGAGWVIASIKGKTEQLAESIRMLAESVDRLHDATEKQDGRTRELDRRVTRLEAVENRD